MGTKNKNEVGYRKPPESTQFKKGQSGNPRGRPRGRLNVATVIEKALREKVVINENGQRKTVTKLEAAAKQAVNKAVSSGDPRALQQLASLARFGEEQSTAEATAPAAAMTDTDQKVLEGILERYGVSFEGGKDAEAGTE